MLICILMAKKLNNKAAGIIYFIHLKLLINCGRIKNYSYKNKDYFFKITAWVQTVTIYFLEVCCSDIVLVFFQFFLC